jgi:hypothetical protein
MAVQAPAGYGMEEMTCTDPEQAAAGKRAACELRLFSRIRAAASSARVLGIAAAFSVASGGLPSEASRRRRPRPKHLPE